MIAPRQTDLATTHWENLFEIYKNGSEKTVIDKKDVNKDLIESYISDIMSIALSRFSAFDSENVNINYDKKEIEITLLLERDSYDIKNSGIYYTVQNSCLYYPENSKRNITRIKNMITSTIPVKSFWIMLSDDKIFIEGVKIVIKTEDFKALSKRENVFEYRLTLEDTEIIYGQLASIKKILKSLNMREKDIPSMVDIISDKFEPEIAFCLYQICLSLRYSFTIYTLYNSGITNICNYF